MPHLVYRRQGDQDDPVRLVLVCFVLLAWAIVL